MKRKLAVLTAAIIGLSTTAFTTVLPQEFNAFTEIDASALTIIAEIKELSLEKDTIEIGETTHLNVKFDSGITDNAECGSSNSSVVKVVSGSVKDGWEIEGVGEGTAKILVHNGIYEKSVEITVTSGGTVEMVPYHITNGDTVEFYGSENDEFLVCCKEAKTFDFTMDEDTHNFTPKEDGMYIITRMEHVYDVVNVSEYHVHCDYPNYYNYMVNVENSEISVKVEGMYSGYNNYALEAYLGCDDEKPEVCNKIGCQGEYSFSDGVSALVSYWNGRMNSQIYYPSIERNGAVLPCIAFKRVDENSITNEDRKLDFAFIECSSGTNGNFEFTTPDLLSVAITMGSWDLFESQTGTTYFSISKNNETVNYAVDIDEDDRIIQSSLRIVDDAIKGDANCDNNVNMADAVLIMQSLANPDKYGVNGTDETHITAQGEKNGDMDGNGLTNADALEIQKILLKLNDTPEQISPIQPPTVQSIHFENISSLAKEINDYDLDKYSEISREGYRKMYDTIKNDGSIYEVKVNEAVKIDLERGIAVVPNAKYEDLGIYSYTKNDFQIIVYYIDKGTEHNGIADYFTKRFSQNILKEISVNGKETVISEFGITDDTRRICASAFIDDSHYYTVRSCVGGTEEELTAFLNNMTFVNVPIA